jgi:hypothetical protein
MILMKTMNLFAMTKIDFFYVRRSNIKKMGYTTVFKGYFLLSRSLTPNEIVEYKNFKPEFLKDEYNQWEIVDNKLQWDRGEKFYNYEYWLHIIISLFFVPKEIQLKGKILFQGDHEEDCGFIEIGTTKRKTYKIKRLLTKKEKESVREAWKLLL